jgi:hypothetical protein
MPGARRDGFQWAAAAFGSLTVEAAEIREQKSGSAKFTLDI